MGLSVVILAAGQGKRMHSALPKVLHSIGGVSFLERVVNTAHQINAKVYVVYGFGGEQVRQKLSHLNVEWIEQKERLGTGHAVLQALPNIDDNDQVLVLVGDSPLVSVKTLERLIAETSQNGIGLVTTELDDPSGFGRILHDQTGKVLSIIEHKDATLEQRKIKEINSGIIIAPAKQLKHWLPSLGNNNAQGEYYLTDIIALSVSQGHVVRSVLADSPEEVLGINDRAQLAKLERHYQIKMAKQLMLSGITILDPQRFDLRGELKAQRDVTIDINVILEGDVTIGQHSYIGANCVLKDCIIGDNVVIEPNSIIEGAVVENNCTIGPFARLRPGTHLETSAKVGNFVEMKKTQFGANSKANHLAYIGDSIVGKDVNIGAGTITCNYDGVNKNQTIIEDGVFIGSNSQLVAPVMIGKYATIGAGSTITQNAPANQLTLGRARQVTIDNWERPKKTDE